VISDKLIFNINGPTWIEAAATTVTFISHDEYQRQNHLDITKSKLGQLIREALRLTNFDNDVESREQKENE
jgi:hypothetical protein